MLSHPHPSLPSSLTSPGSDREAILHGHHYDHQLCACGRGSSCRSPRGGVQQQLIPRMRPVATHPDADGPLPPIRSRGGVCGSGNRQLYGSPLPLSLASFRPMINETASVIGYALNAEKAGAVGRRGMAREVIDQTRKNIEGRGCVINAIQGS